MTHPTIGEMGDIPEGCPTENEFKNFLKDLDRLGPIGDTKLLGKGSYGSVYKHKDWVVKILNILDPFTNSTFHRERDVYMRISQIKELADYTVPFCWSGENAGGYGFIVQKYVKAEPMDVFLERKPLFSFHTGFHIIVNLAKGVEALHTAGFVHRDLKPANILIRVGSGHEDRLAYTPILIDFGFACAMPCMEKGRLGTPDYMPGDWASSTELLRVNPNIKNSQPFRKSAWLTRKAKPENARKTPKNRWTIGVVESRKKPTNVNSAIRIKTQASRLEPEYSENSDNYALHLILKQLYKKTDWTGQDLARERVNEYITKLLGRQVGSIAAQLSRGASPEHKERQLKRQLETLESFNRYRNLTNRNISRNPLWNKAGPAVAAVAWKKYQNGNYNGALKLLRENEERLKAAETLAGIGEQGNLNYNAAAAVRSNMRGKRSKRPDPDA